jgi:methionyl-tRNA formyltransferase
MRPLLLGGTDLSLAVAERMRKIGIPPVGVVHVGKKFTISYSETGVNNMRFADLSAWCDRENISHRTYENSNTIAMFAEEIRADFCLAAGWYHMVPAKLRERFALGTAGFHASLLPRLRGGAPLNWAILSGEKEAGISLFALGDGVDDGPIYGQERFPIGLRTTISDIVSAAEAGALAIVEHCLPKIAAGSLKPWPQSGEATYCLQRVPEDGAIDWKLSAVEIDRLVRAVSRPYPGAFSWFEKKKIIIWATETLDECPQVFGAPGQIVRLPSVSDLCVVTGAGILVIREACEEAGGDIIPLLRRAANRRFVSDV